MLPDTPVPADRVAPPQAVDLTQCHLAAVADNRTEDVRVTGRCHPPELCFHVDPAFGKIAAKGEQLLTIE